MDSFYIILLPAIVASAVIGYVLGGIRMLITLANLLVAAAAAWFLFEQFAALLSEYFNMQLSWAYPVSIAIVFFACFSLFHLIISSFLLNISTVHGNILNRMAGMILGITLMGTCFLFSVYYNEMVPIPANLRQDISETGITEMVDRKIQQVTDKLNSLPQEEPVQLMAVKGVETGNEEGIYLSFSTTGFIARPGLELEMLRLINTERAGAGLKPLSFDSLLMSVARLHSTDMLTRGYFSHHTPEGADPFQRLQKNGIRYHYAGENLALAPTLLKAHDGLMKSPGHRANILSPSYGRVGIGVMDAGVHGLMITQEFRD